MPSIIESKPLEVVAGIIWQQGRILAARRPKEKTLGNYWEFPGGKMELGEGMEEALFRELREELSIKAESVSYWKSFEHAYPQYTVLLHFLHVNSFSGEAKAMEGQNLKWVYPHEALKMDFLPPDLPLLKELADKDQNAAHETAGNGKL